MVIVFLDHQSSSAVYSTIHDPYSRGQRWGNNNGGLTKAFWEFMDARAMTILDDVDETQTQWKLASILEQGGYNVGNAIEISLHDDRFAERRIFLYIALTCLALPRLTISQLLYWEKVFDSILERYKFLEYEVPEEELSNYRAEPVAKRILDDVILLACQRQYTPWLSS
jgi:hypothetical protein